MKFKNKSEIIKKIAKYSFFGLLILTVIFGFILSGWYLEKYYVEHKNYFKENFIIKKLSFKEKHRILNVIFKLLLYFFISITAIGFLILFGYMMRKYYIKNKGKIYQKLTNYKEFNTPKSMRLR